MKKSTLTFVSVYKPASEQTDEDRRLLARGFMAALYLPLVGDVAHPPAPPVKRNVSAEPTATRRAKKGLCHEVARLQEVQPCPTPC